MAVLDELTKHKGRIVLVAVLGLILRYKIPLVCAGCDDYATGPESLFFRCVGGTGKGTKMCSVSESASEFVDETASVGDAASVFVRESFLLATTEIPARVKEEFWRIVQKIRDFLKTLLLRTSELREHLVEQIRILLDKTKDVLIKSREGMRTHVIDPAMAIALKFMVQPAQELIMQLIRFKDLVIKTVSDIVSGATGIAYDGSQLAFQAVPEGVNVALKSMIDSINNVKNEVMGIVQTSVNTVTAGLNTTTGRMEDGINKVSVGITATTSKATNSVVDGVELSVNAMVQQLNRSMEDTVAALNAGVKGVTSGIDSSMNVVEGTVTGAVNAVVDPVNSVISVLDEVKGVKIVGARPFGWISVPKKVPPIKWDIPNVPFAPVKAPSVKPVELPPVVVPAIEKLDIPDLVAPTVKVPADVPGIPEIPPPPIRVASSVNSAVSSVVTKVNAMIAKGMKPVNDLIVDIVALFHTLIASLASGLRKIAAACEEGMYRVYAGARGGAREAYEFFRDRVMIRVVEFVRKSVSAAAEAIAFVIDTVKELVRVTIVRLREIFGTIISVVGNVLKKVLATTAGVAFFIVANFIDRATKPIRLPVTVKVNTLAFLILYIVLAPYKSAVFSKTGLIVGSATGLLTLIGLGLNQVQGDDFPQGYGFSQIADTEPESEVITAPSLHVRPKYYVKAKAVGLREAYSDSFAI